MGVSAAPELFETGFIMFEIQELNREKNIELLIFAHNLLKILLKRNYQEIFFQQKNASKKFSQKKSFKNYDFKNAFFMSLNE